ncbi:Selenophosphate-dependent tRNA 2-selenouridine synthase [hydrothermal vent metagenome]|uniref:Selenophosphate-dependent tRNA 2-selenouridine synthase n=1 Tax=hydrothermal vent metagenome TaxID=652676 RepID=A0A3B0ZE45_9ZZZZ
MSLPQVDDYQTLFLNDTPMIDLRAPVEFAQGAFPHALSLPLMSDDERKRVGTCYKEQGQQSAIKLGHELVAGEIKAQRLAGWAQFIEQNPQGALYCFRGGLRSQITQQWIYEETGIAYPRVIGGYKQLRRYLIDELERSVAQMQSIILSGRTGTGKTLLLKKVKNSIDLEGIYHHRGSAFGRHATPQPSQIDVENRLSIALLKKRIAVTDTRCQLLFEDEGSNIGSRNLPASLVECMAQASVVVLEVPLEQRVGIVFDEYITAALAEYQQLLGEEQGFSTWADSLQQALGRVKRRLGGERYGELSAVMDSAISSQQQRGDCSGHREWICQLLEGYYDPMYDYQLSKKAERILFRGDEGAVLEYLHGRGII